MQRMHWDPDEIRQFPKGFTEEVASGQWGFGFVGGGEKMTFPVGIFPVDRRS